jgi:hypothetical protein
MLALQPRDPFLRDRLILKCADDGVGNHAAQDNTEQRRERAED